MAVEVAYTDRLIMFHNIPQAFDMVSLNAGVFELQEWILGKVILRTEVVVAFLVQKVVVYLYTVFMSFLYVIQI